jgi:predicted DNA repair protein MutK
VSSGLLGLFDDVAALAKLAAASVDDIGAAAGRASVKAAGVVVDDTAVTPAYVHGLAADRELPIIKRIALGSLKNKLLFIIPVALVLSEFVPVLVEIVLMLGGTYLCFEGAEKIHHRLAHRDGEDAHELPASALGADQEEQTVAGAIRTDFILSGEIIVIALKDVLDRGFVARAAILVIVAVVITAVVYGVVALIVKMDDIGLHLAGRRTGWVQSFGRGLVTAMPKVMSVISTVGIAAMLWVGGHILLQGSYDLGWHAPYDLLHHLEEAVHGVPGVGGVLAWLVDTLGSAIVGVVVGGIVVAVMHLIPRRKQHH